MTTARKTKATPAAPVRCAIYTRKSTEEGLGSRFQPLDAQREPGRVPATPFDSPEYSFEIK